MSLDLDAITLRHGAHNTRDDGVCALEAVAWLAGEEHSDRPGCVCPVVAAFVRVWNDALPSDGDRDRLLKPLLPAMVGTASTPEAPAVRPARPPRPPTRPAAATVERCEAAATASAVDLVKRMCEVRP